MNWLEAFAFLAVAILLLCLAGLALVVHNVELLIKSVDPYTREDTDDDE